MLLQWHSLLHFFAFIAFIALGASAAAFFAPFFAMLLITGDRKGTLGMQASLKTSFLEPDQSQEVVNYVTCQCQCDNSLILPAATPLACNNMTAT